MMKNLFKTLLLNALVLAMLVSCNEEEAITPPLTVGFENPSINLTSADTQTEIKLVFARALSEDATIVLDLASNDLTYGEKADYYTNPEVVNNQITFNLSAGASEASFTLNKNNFNLEQEKRLTISINNLQGEALLANGDHASLNVIFSENPALASGTIEADMGGADQTHQVFIDLSTGEMTRVSRFSWDLGFHNEAGQFKVMLNNGGFVMAKQIDETDLNNISESDISSFKDDMVIPNYSNTDAANWIDNANGDFSEAVIGDISATDSDNKVFIISSINGSDRVYHKIRVIRNGDNYTLQYADVNATSFNTTEITKNDNYEFTYFSLATSAIVSSKPKKDLWDIAFTQYANKFSAGPNTFAVSFKDYVIQNTNQVSVAMVMGDEMAYNNFTSAEVSNQTFETAVNALGSNWRSGGGPGGGPSLYTDRFFVVNDTNGNIYKVRFTRMTDPNTNERGYPAFEYEKL